MKKKFFWQDKSGRGVTNKFALTDLIKMSDPEELSYSDETLEDWANEAEEGDVWETSSEKYTCIES